MEKVSEKLIFPKQTRYAGLSRINVGYIEGCQPLLIFNYFKIKYLITSLVEVAGIEPASEGLQPIEPTCVSNPFDFRKRDVRIGSSAEFASSLSFG